MKFVVSVTAKCDHPINKRQPENFLLVTTIDVMYLKFSI